MGGHIWTHPDCKSPPIPARWKRDACIYPASYSEEAHGSSGPDGLRALRLLIRSTAFDGPAPRRF